MRVEFYGPIEVYGGMEAGQWVLWAEPCSTAGIGASMEEALAALHGEVERLFLYVQKEMRKGESVGMCVELMPGLRTTRHATFRVCVISEGEQITPARVLRSMDGLYDVLKDALLFAVTPAWR